jgi:hypothetical protein
MEIEWVSIVGEWIDLKIDGVVQAFYKKYTDPPGHIQMLFMHPDIQNEYLSLDTPDEEVRQLILQRLVEMRLDHVPEP